MRVSYVRGGSRAIWHCCIHRPRRFVGPRYDAWVRLAVLVALLVAACGRIGFESSDEQFLPAHLDEPPPHATASLVLRDTIDTTALTIDGTAPAPGASFSTRLQQAGPEVALLLAGDVTVPAGSTVRVIGTRPLVIVATAIQIDGVIDAGARGATPGPGGGASGQGAGAGSSTQKPAADVCDPGAGGGGFAQAGASGGSESCTGDAGAGGVVYGDDMLVTLVAGSGGGRGSGGDCASSAGGGGGGAIQLTAFRLLSVTGGITAGGGGGRGGPDCGTGDAGAGGGGGAGGAIFLQARTLDLRGTLAANGGGGGAGGNGDPTNGPVGDGEPGEDATLLASGTGGVAITPTSSGNGGDGGTDVAPPTPGIDAEYNPGGGGGGVGRIVVEQE